MEDTPWWVDTVLSIIGVDNCVISGIPLDLPGGGESQVEVVPEDAAEGNHFNPEQYLDDGLDAEPVWDLLNTADPPACMDISVAEEVKDTQETVFNISSSPLDVSFTGPAVKNGKSHAAALATSQVKQVDGSSPGRDPIKSLKPLRRKTSVKGPTDRLANLQKRKRGLENDAGQEATKLKKDKKTVKLVGKEIHRVQLEAEKLQVEKEKLQVEKEKLQVEKEKLQVEKEKLQVEKEKLQVEKEVLEMQKANEMMKRMNLYYQALHLERQLNVPSDSGVQQLVRSMNIPLNMPPVSPEEGGGCPDR